MTDATISFSRPRRPLRTPIWLVLGLLTCLAACDQKLGQSCEIDRDCVSGLCCIAGEELRGTCVEEMERAQCMAVEGASDDEPTVDGTESPQVDAGGMSAVDAGEDSDAG